jgi:hypothetical protein
MKPATTQTQPSDALLAKCRAYVSQFRNVMLGLEIVDLLQAEGLYAEILGPVPSHPGGCGSRGPSLPGSRAL